MRNLKPMPKHNGGEVDSLSKLTCESGMESKNIVTKMSSMIFIQPLIQGNLQRKKTTY